MSDDESSSDSGEDEMFNASGIDRSHEVFQWEELKAGAENRERKVRLLYATLYGHLFRRNSCASYGQTRELIYSCEYISNTSYGHSE